MNDTGAARRRRSGAGRRRRHRVPKVITRAPGSRRVVFTAPGSSLEITTSSDASAGEPHESVLEGVLRAVVVEVIGVDVRDRGRRRCRRAGTNRRIRRPRPRTGRPRRRPNCTPRALSTPPLTKLGSAPSSQQRRDDHRRSRWSCRGRRRPPPGGACSVSQASAAARCSTGMPARPRCKVFRVVLRDGAGDHERVGAADVLGLVADRDRRRPAPGARARCRCRGCLTR